MVVNVRREGSGGRDFCSREPILGTDVCLLSIGIEEIFPWRYRTTLTSGVPSQRWNPLEQYDLRGGRIRKADSDSRKGRRDADDLPPKIVRRGKRTRGQGRGRGEKRREEKRREEKERVEKSDGLPAQNVVQRHRR